MSSFRVYADLDSPASHPRVWAVFFVRFQYNSMRNVAIGMAWS